jgi:uncharacterized protein (TIGR00299 family) protein
MILWLNPISGLSGDMLLAALLDLGAPLDAVNAAVASTGLSGWDLEVTQTFRQGLRACSVRVVAHDDATVRGAAELIGLVGRAEPEPVAAMALVAVRALAEVEAGIHGVDVAEVQLHEIGGVDTVVDVVGVAAALHALGVTEVWSAPLRLGAGETASAHGLLPVPAPATVALLRGVPVVGIDSQVETVTPTGAALLLAIGARYGPMPAMTVQAAGYGAGGRDTANRPNVLPALLGVGSSDSSGSHTGTQTEGMTLVETTVDDVTGEVLGQLVERLLDSGAADAWLATVLGKKGRPAHVVSALCHDRELADVEETLLRETGTLGLRRTSVQRRALPRTTGQITIDGEPVRVKTGPYRAKAEHDDLLAIARKRGVPLREVVDRATVAGVAVEDEQGRT